MSPVPQRRSRPVPPLEPAPRSSATSADGTTESFRPRNYIEGKSSYLGSVVLIGLLWLALFAEGMREAFGGAGGGFVFDLLTFEIGRAHV